MKIKSAKPRSGRQPGRRSVPKAEELLVELLTELAAVLLAGGVSSPEFEIASKVAFVKAASRTARLGNERVNKSAVAAMTGLSRAEVKRLAGTVIPGEATRQGQRALRVLDGWQMDPDFQDAAGNPRALTLDVAEGEFEELVRRYSGDIPPRAIMRELERLQLVSIDDGAVRVNRTDPDSRPLHHLQTLVAALGPILANLSSPKKSAPRLLARELSISFPDQKAHRLFHKQVNEAVRSFFLSLQSAAEGASLQRGKRQKSGFATRVCVLISE